MKQSYRILIVHNRYQIPGGEDTVVENEMAMLKKYGHEVFYYERNNSELNQFTALQKMKLPFQTIYSLKTKNEIKHLIQTHQIDLVHVHNTLLLVSPSVYDAAKECNVPVIQTVHNFRFLCPNGLFFRDGKVCEECLKNGLSCSVKHSCYRSSKAQTIIVAAALKRMRLAHVFDRIYCICLTEFNKQKLLSSGFFREDHLYLKPNFVSGTGSPLPYDRRNHQVVFAGRLEEIKGIRFLLEVWKHRKDDLKLIVCGDGPLREECRKFIEQNHLSNVVLRGQVPHEEVLDLIRESKAMVFASQVYEGFPMSIAESFSCGTPVLAPSFGNGGALVKEGINGFHYEPGSVNSCLNALDQLLNKEDYDLSAMTAQYSEETNYGLLKHIYDDVMTKESK